MQTELKKRYGLITAMAMVVGIVIGSGVFFKAEKVLTATGGNLPLGIVAWVLGGLIMVACAYTFGVMATRYEYVSGVVDYAEAAMGSRYAYYLGWILAVVYYPTLTSVLAWVSARYTCVLFGLPPAGGECMMIASVYLIGCYVLNALAPVISGKFQVAATVIKLIPLYLIAAAGIAGGLSSGMLNENFTTAVTQVDPKIGLFTAVVATAFAYDGWIVATSINAELRDARKNLPRALTGGALIVMITYVLYYIGLAGAVSNQTMMAGGEEGAKIAFGVIFSDAGGTLLFVFVVISCLGTLNGLTIGCSRGMYMLAARNQGPHPEVFSQVDRHTNMAGNSAAIGLFFSVLWLFFFYGANIDGTWFGLLRFDSSELPVVTLYVAYIPIFLVFIKKSSDLSFLKRFFMPVIAIIGCLFMMVAAVFSHGKTIVAYLVVLAVIIAAGAFFEKRKETDSL